MAGNMTSTGLTSKYVLAAGETTIKSGSPYVKGTIPGVVSSIKRNGQPVFINQASQLGDVIVVLHQGQFSLPKKAGEAIAAGAIVYLETAGKVITATAAGGVLFGKAAAAALSADAFVEVMITEAS